MPHLLGRADSLIESDIQLCLCSAVSFCLLGVSGGLWWPGRLPHLDLSVVSSQCHHNQTCCFGNVIANFFWRQTQGTYLGGQGRCGTDLTLGAPQVHTALVSLGTNLGSVVSPLVLIGPELGVMEESFTIDFPGAKGWKAREHFKPAVLWSFCFATIDFPLVRIIKS